MASHLASLGKNTAVDAVNWNQAADALGASLLDLARLEALAERHSAKMAEGCDGSVASVAQQLREARAMLDHCRMRAACIGKRGAGTTTKVSVGDIEEVFSRATATAQGLVANEIGEAVIPAADSPEPSMLEVLRNQGVCRKASELIQASTAAPAVTQAVASSLPTAVAPSTGVVSPQDLVSGAVQSALNAPSTADSNNAEVTQTAAPANRQAAVPQFTGSAFGFGGGEGGPALQEPPSEEPTKK